MATIDNYNAIYEGYNHIAEKIEYLQSEIFDNMELSDFKNYLLDELTKLKIQLLDYQTAFTEDYCKDSEEKEFNMNRLQQKIESEKNSLNQNGLSL